MTDYEYKVGDYVEVIDANCYNEHPAGIKGHVSEVGGFSGGPTILTLKGPEVEPYTCGTGGDPDFLVYLSEVRLVDPEPTPAKTTISSINYGLYSANGQERGLDMEGTGDDFYDFLTLPEIRELQTFLNHHFGEV